MLCRRRCGREDSESESASEESDEDELIHVGDDSQEDRSAGANAFAIPEAFIPFDSTGMPSAEATMTISPNDDLRRYLLPGDIVNILGGNIWGHCGLVTDCSKVSQTPLLLDRIPPREKDGQPEVKILDYDIPIFMVDVLQSASNMPDIFVSQMGLVVHPDSKEIVMVKKIPQGAVIRRSPKGTLMLAQVLLSPFNEATLDRSLLQQVTREVIKAEGGKWSKKTAVRAFFRKAVLRPKRYKTRRDRQKLAQELENSWLSRPVCSTVPPRVWQKYLQRRSLLTREPLPSENSEEFEMERGQGSWSHLLYCGREGVVPLEEQTDSCTFGLCCHSSDACGPDRGTQCHDCFLAQWALPSDDPDPQIAFVEDVLRLMPVKDDRCLPEELVAQLLQTHLWQELNLHSRPPAHRRKKAG